jgi:hypothetical protein
MKNMFSSASIFEAYVQIDYCYWVLSEIQKKLSEKKQPIVQMVDESTGFAQKELQDLKKNAIEMFKCIIKNKKKVKIDYSDDETRLNELLKFA